MMAKRIYGYITRIIHNLTNDEDLRQDLWLYILEGHSPFNLEQHYLSLKDQENKDGFEEKLH